MSHTFSSGLARRHYALLCGVAVSALAVATPAMAGDFVMPPGPAWFGSVEGGAACPFGDEIGYIRDDLDLPAGVIFNHRSHVELGNGDCGWTGRLGVGQTGPGSLFSWTDYWGVFVRHTDGLDDKARGIVTSDITYVGNLFPNYSGLTTGHYDEERTVVDFEIGREVGLGMPGRLRLFGGLRYANFSSDTKFSGTQTGPEEFFYTTLLRSESDFWGVGPRVGLQKRVAFGQSWGLLLNGSGSALVGKHDTHTRANVFAEFFNSTTITKFKKDDTDWIGNLEGEAALTFQPFGSRSELAIGARVEAWFDQSQDYAVRKGDDLDRNSWGPFARFTVSFGGGP